MTYYIFAIGGTGARCLESLVFLCAMGLGPEHLHPIMVDPDTGNGNQNRTIELINFYRQIRSQIENPQAGSLFFTDIIYEATEAGKDTHKKIPNKFDPNTNISSKDNKVYDTLSSFIEYDTVLSKDNKKHLAELLFSSDELNMKMDEGYRAVPSIGSVLMTGIEEHPFWRVFIDSLKGNPSDKVFIFSSVFGGTGASGYPVISQLIKKAYRDAEVGGALLLPYFKLRDPRNLLQDEEYKDLKKEKILPNFNSFLQNTRAACEYYRNNFSDNDANYIVGDDVDLCKLYEKFSLGSTEQKNPAHFIELIAAYAALDFANKEKGRHKDFLRILVKNPGDDPEKKENNVTADDLPHEKKAGPFERFSLVYHYVNDIYRLIDKSNSVVLDKIAWLRKMKYRGDDMLEQKQNLTPLYDFCDRYQEWINQNHTNEAKLDLLDENLTLEKMVSSNPKKYEHFNISSLDVKLYHKNKRKTQFVDCFISSLSKARILKGGR